MENNMKQIEKHWVTFEKKKQINNERTKESITKRQTIHMQTKQNKKNQNSDKYKSKKNYKMNMNTDREKTKTQ